MLVQSVHASTALSSPSNWVEVEVRSFDGEGITAAITLSVTGNHENASVRVYGESSAGVGENIPCLTVVCMTSSVGYSVGRIIREVTFSLDTNRTTFHYATRFLSPNYEANTLLGIPPFPIDEHKLNLTMTTDFQVDIDGHWKTPILPTSNYDGKYQVIAQGLQDKQYSYSLVLEIYHPFLFTVLMSLLTWGTIALLSVLTGSLVYRRRERPPISGDIATVSSAIIVFVPVFELSLQAFKSPLGITPSDFFVFILLVSNVCILVDSRHGSKRARSSVGSSSDAAKENSPENDVKHTPICKSSATLQLGHVTSRISHEEETAEIKRILIEHDVFSSLDGVLLLLMPLATLGIGVVPQLLRLPLLWHYLAGLIVIATVVFLVSLVLLMRAKLAGSGSITSITGRAEAWTFPFIFLSASASSLLILALTHLVLGGDILIISLENLALVTFGCASLGHALASYPTRWLARNLKDRMPWRSDEIERAFSTTPFVRASYGPIKWTLIQSLIGSVLLLLYVLSFLVRAL
jgi:hypothetical protein